MEEDDLELSRKFLEGLWEKYKMTRQDLIEGGYNYCGGDKDDKEQSIFYRTYFEERFEGRKALKEVSRCVCGHAIYYNCYICNGDDDYDSILILGSCCVRKFIPNGMKQIHKCKNIFPWGEVCGDIHRRRVKKICEPCEKGLVRCTGITEEGIWCKNRIDKKYSRCEDCWIPGICRGVGCYDKMNDEYDYCWKCLTKNAKKWCKLCNKILTNDKYDMCYPCSEANRKPIVSKCRICEKGLTNDKYAFCWKCTKDHVR